MQFQTFYKLIHFAFDTGVEFQDKVRIPQNDRNVVPLTEFLDCTHDGNAIFFALCGHSPVTIF